MGFGEQVEEWEEVGKKNTSSTVAEVRVWCRWIQSIKRSNIDINLHQHLICGLSHCCWQAKFDESAISGLFRIMVRSVFKKQGRKASARIEPSLGLALGIHVRSAEGCCRRFGRRVNIKSDAHDEAK